MIETFKELDFKPLPIDGEQAIMCFANGYSVKVSNGLGAFCDHETFEVSVHFEGYYLYSKYHQTEQQITDLMAFIQEL